MKEFIRFYIFRSFWAIMVMVIGALYSTANYSRAQHEIFDASVIQKWKDYEAFSHGLQGTAHSQIIRNGKSEESTFRFKQNRECALFIEPNHSDPSFLRCSLVNPHYTAAIKLSNSNPDNAVLQSYLPRSGDTESLSYFDFVVIQTSRHFYYGGKQWLRHAISEPSFKVTKATEEIQGGKKLIRVDHAYDFGYRMAGNDYRARTHGTLWLDPSQCWCIHRSKKSTEIWTGGERGSDTVSELECETIDHPSGFPILKSITEHRKTFQHKLKQTIDLTTKTNYELEVSDNVPDSEFTLTAFGLPEPGSEPVKKPIPLFVWILVAAGVCAALALGFGYLARRRVRSQPIA